MRLKSGRTGVDESAFGTDIFNRASSDSEIERVIYTVLTHSHGSIILKENEQKLASMIPAQVDVQFLTICSRGRDVGFSS